MLKCKICGMEFAPIVEDHYVSRDDSVSGLAAAIRSPEGKHYDSFDCPNCGCQVIAQERKRAVVWCEDVEEEENEDA